MNSAKKMQALLMFLMPLIGFAQESKGIRFVQGLSWNQVMQKAKEEHKYIFLDCYATWCGPCKKMDQEIYSLKQVGDYYNDHFVSVKMQMDQTNGDDSLVKKWYGLANNFQTTYSVTSLPTFLFFSPDGKAVHKVSATKTSMEFIEVGKDAQDSTKQYYSVVKNFEPGKIETAELKGFIKAFQSSDKVLATRMARDYLNRISKKQMAESDNVDIVRVFQNDSSVKRIAKAYVITLKRKDLNEQGNRDLILMFFRDSSIQIIAQDYINHLSEKKLYTSSIISLMSAFTPSSRDRGFDFIYHHSVEVDTILHNPGWAKMFVGFIIRKEEIVPKMKEASNSNTGPDWDRIYRVISDKFNSNYAETLTLSAKVDWYYSKKDWANYTRYLVEKINRDSITKYPPKGFYPLFGVNVAAWDIFQYSDNKQELEMAVSWSNTVLDNMDGRSGPNYGACMDTKANLLYKLGRREEALALEAKAAALCDKDKGVQEAFAKMQQGLPTWPVRE